MHQSNNFIREPRRIVVLDGLDDRLFATHVMKNKITGVTTLVTSHDKGE